MPSRTRDARDVTSRKYMVSLTNPRHASRHEPSRTIRGCVATAISRMYVYIQCVHAACRDIRTYTERTDTQIKINVEICTI